MSRDDTSHRISLQKSRDVDKLKITALLIEDDSDIGRFVVKTVGQAKGGRIVLDRARSLPEGLVRLSSPGVDVVIFGTPSLDANATETIARIAAQSPRVPIIVLTGESEDNPSVLPFPEGVLEILTIRHATADRLIGAVRSWATYGRGLEEARQSAEKLRLLFWGIPVPAYVWKFENDDFILTDYNNAALTITEGKISDFVGQSVSQMYRDFPELIDDMHRCYHERITIKKETLYHFMSTGRDRYLEITYGFVPPDLVFVHTVDITERKEAIRILRQFNSKLESTVYEQTSRLTRVNEELAAEIQERARTEDILAESERRYRFLIENASEGIIVVQQDRIVFANPRAVEAMGYPTKELTARNLMDFVHPEDREKVLAYHMKGLAGESPPPMTYRIVTREGKVIWTEVDGVLIEWEGKPSGLLFYKDVTDRMEAQRALRESEEKYRRVVENADEGIVISQASHMKFVNPKVVKELGYTEEELTSRPFIELIHPDDREMVMRHHLDGIAGKDVEPTIAYRIFDHDGVMRWIEVTGVRITWENEPSVLLFIKDISDRKVAEEAIRESEEKYRIVVENASEGIVINQDGVIRFANPKLCEIAGYDREELIGRPLTDIVHPDERETALSRYRAKIDGAPIELPFPYRLVDKKGEIKWIDVNSVSVTWKGRPAVLVFADDITQRKLQEDRLRESEDRYRDLVENTGDLVYIMDGEGHFKLVNRTIEREYGYSAADLAGKGFGDIVTPGSYERAAEIFKKQLKGMQVEPFELDIYDSYGQVRTVEIRERLVWTGKRITEVHGIARDVTDRKRAEAALKESEEKYRLVVENASEGIVVVQGTSMEYVNPKIPEWTGFTREELSSRPFLDFIPPEDHELVIRQHQSLLKGERAAPFITHRVIDREGRFLWIEVSGVLVDWRGSPATLLFVKDVTERKRIEDALRESEEKYRLVVENAEEIITIAVGDNLIFANRKALEMSGYSGDEALSIPVIDMIHPDDREMVLRYRDKRIRGEQEPQSFVMRLIKKDGRTVWLQNSVVPIAWEGKPAALDVATDITERKMIEDALRESEEKYRLVVENADEVIIVAVDGYLQLFNKKTAEVFGYSEKEMLTTPVIEFFHPDDRETVLEYRRKREEGEKQHQFFTARMVTKDGRTVWMQCSTVPFVWRGKDAALVIANDVTERKLIEDALRESEEKYRVVVENANEIVVITQDGIVKFANNRVMTLFSVPPEALLGRHLSDLVIREDREKLRDEYRKLVSGEEVLPFYRYRMRDGKGNTRFIEVSGITLTWEGVPSVLSFVSDITERVQAERALQESEDFTRGLVENSPLGILYLDRVGTITYENPMSWVITSGMFDETRPSRAIGMSVYDLPGIRDYPDSKAIIDKILSGQIVTNYTLPYTSITGKRTILNVSGAPRIDSDDTQVGAVILISDITEKVRAEEEIKRRLRYEEAVAFCTRELVASTDLDRSMHGIVESLLEKMEVGGVFICKNVMDPVEGLSMLTISEAIDKRYRPPINFPIPNRVAYKYRSPEMLEALTNGRPFGGPTRDYPPIDRDILSLIGSLSSITIPITADGKFWGLIGFDDYESERVWDEQDILLLQTISSMIGTAVARHEAQVALVESERRYREVVDSTNDIIYVMDYRGNFKYVNNAVRQLGYEPDEILGRNIYEFYASSSRKYAQELFRLQRAGAQLRGYELDILRKDGQVRTMEFRDDFRWEGDRIVEVQGIGRDVTDRKKREDRLRFVAESQGAVLDSLPDTVFFTDLTLKITWANRAASRLTGLSIEEMVGRFCFEVLHLQDAPCEGCPAIVSLVTDRVETNNSMFCFGATHKIVAYPVSDMSGDVTGMAISIGDVRSEHILDITQSLSQIEDEIEDERDPELFLAPLDPNYIYPFHLSIDFQKDTFIITLTWDEFRKKHLLKRLARSESAVARFLYLAARMKTDGTGWVDKDLIKAGTMDTNLNKLRSLLEDSNVPFLDRFSARMLIRSNKEEKKKVRLAISPSNIEISSSVRNFRSKKHRYLATVSKKIKRLRHDMANLTQPNDYLVSELAIQRQNETNLKKSIDIVETLIREASILLKL